MHPQWSLCRCALLLPQWSLSRKPSLDLKPSIVAVSPSIGTVNIDSIEDVNVRNETAGCPALTESAHKMSIKLSLFIFVFMIIGAMFFGAEAEPLEDEQAFLDFFHKIDHSEHLNWGYKTSLCNARAGQ
ncbi:hypothetical protein HN51_045652 [Arachis hypogaea]|uniref:Uncharacterized protein n=1 Tax=Arachis hypogaea TaxID=3818 RepID=A0A444XXW9_ARAHY|nr:uncharacterized protein LOC110266111 [Arachis ipaensis]XP_020965690.1 uncharacterized protein LOC110266111 [Arachis ipaensis]XP_025670669.1 uncharacterized protein LOC112770542 [Arachis hypogaea]XP_029150617.1 uncharacterized protein LOC112770542 [Arachis hypogaea]QHN97951.1 uncharacterized protein DS421_18g631820 [Arachis hypogaea]RYQ94523.1 hypothetical protein Ahy_B08g089454 [Arachis hypogaea]